MNPLPYDRNRVRDRTVFSQCGPGFAPISLSQQPEFHCQLILNGNSKRRTRTKMTFPQTLHQILEDSINAGTEDIVAWEDDGASFHIFQPQALNDLILPRYYKKRTKFRSFQRQLNIYGFKMSKKSGVYQHPLFRRGDLRSVGRIRPIPLKKAKKQPEEARRVEPKAIAIVTESDEDEPNTSSRITIEKVLSISSHRNENSGDCFDLFEYNALDNDDNICIDQISFEQYINLPSAKDIDLFEDIENIQDCGCKCNGSGRCFALDLTFPSFG